MGKRFNIRAKLAAVLVVPLAALVAFAALQVETASDDADVARRQADLASAALGPGGLVSALQQERNQEALEIVGAAVTTDDGAATATDPRADTDHALTTFNSLISRLDSAAIAVYAPVLSQIGNQLEAARSRADAVPQPYTIANSGAANEVFDTYSEMVGAFQRANTRIALGMEDEQLRTGADLLHSVSRQQEIESLLARKAVIGRALDDPASTQEAVALTGARSVGEDRIAALGVEPYASAVDDALADPARIQYMDLLESAASDPGSANVDEITSASAGAQALTDLQNEVATLVAERADGVVNDAEQQQRDFLYLAVGGVLMVVLIALLVSRSISRPLRRLTSEANYMANERLPRAVNQVLETPLGDDIEVPELASISVAAGGEVGRVAEALDQVQTSAVELAVEQAVLRRNFADSFVNLGRRNQNLLGRQLDLVSDLEQSETDPEALENLFRIDHLATRMRRNAESLLVLAGLEPPRQWSAAIPVGDVVRGALGEVEDYQRVEILGLTSAEILGRAAADITHILAELLENGLQFSPPSEKVEVTGQRAVDGYVIAVTDHGFGMSEREIARANQRLAAAESFTVAPSRYLGHYVAAHLAERHRVEIELSASASGGIRAEVSLPNGIVDPDASMDTEERALAHVDHHDLPASHSETTSEPLAPVDELATADIIPSMKMSVFDAEALAKTDIGTASVGTRHQRLHEPTSSLESWETESPLDAASTDSGSAAAATDEPRTETARATTALGLPMRATAAQSRTPSRAASVDGVADHAQPDSCGDSTTDSAKGATLGAGTPDDETAHDETANDATAHDEPAHDKAAHDKRAHDGNPSKAVEPRPEPGAELAYDTKPEALDSDRPIAEGESINAVAPEPSDAAEYQEPAHDGPHDVAAVDDGTTFLPKRRGRRSRSAKPAAPSAPEREAQGGIEPLPVDDDTQTVSRGELTLEGVTPVAVPHTWAASTGPDIAAPAAPEPTSEPNEAAYSGVPPEQRPAPGGDRTVGGLVRRVRGAQMPDDAIVPVRNESDAGSHGEVAAARSAARPSGEEVYNALADFRAGSERGRQSASTESSVPVDEHEPAPNEAADFPEDQ